MTATQRLCHPSGIHRGGGFAAKVGEPFLPILNKNKDQFGEVGQKRISHAHSVYCLYANAPPMPEGFSGFAQRLSKYVVDIGLCEPTTGPSVASDNVPAENASASTVKPEGRACYQMTRSGKQTINGVGEDEDEFSASVGSLSS
ncbi:hypothetical protein Tco_0018870 [Tanacetum coccineum]